MAADFRLQDYWSLVYAFNRYRDTTALTALELMAYEPTLEGRLSLAFVTKHGEGNAVRR